MNNMCKIVLFFQRTADDENIRCNHISLYTVLYKIWVENEFINPIKISRKKLMSMAKIHSQATYHKVIEDLINKNYITYCPSYHPGVGSEVTLL